MQNATILELSDSATPFALWALHGMPEVYDYSAEETPVVPTVSVWRVALPRDARQAAWHMRNVEAAIAAENNAIDQIEEDLDVLTLPQQSTAFVYADGTRYPHSLQRYNALIAKIKQNNVTGALSFGLREVVPNWDEILDQFQKFARSVKHALENYAYVETIIEGHKIARTSVTWTSTLDTFWVGSMFQEHRDQHLRALRLAVASRTALLRTSIIVASGAVQVAKMAALPGGVLLALPIFYDLVRQVGLELQRYQQIVHIVG